jgi:hypothetical protein
LIHINAGPLALVILAARSFDPADPLAGRSGEMSVGLDGSGVER